MGGNEGGVPNVLLGIVFKSSKTLIPLEKQRSEASHFMVCRAHGGGFLCYYVMKWEVPGGGGDLGRAGCRNSVLGVGNEGGRCRIGKKHSVTDGEVW